MDKSDKMMIAREAKNIKKYLYHNYCIDCKDDNEWREDDDFTERDCIDGNCPIWITMGVLDDVIDMNGDKDA